MRKRTLTASLLATIGAGLVLLNKSRVESKGPENAAPKSHENSSNNYWSSPGNTFKPYEGLRKGLLTFRGNPTRNFYGTGPIPTTKPKVRWIYPENSSMCAVSYLRNQGDTWCGMGWTGQPGIFEHKGKLALAFGSFDKKVHMLDALTGKDIKRPFVTGDIIKGSITIDPDGHPYLYIGSRDNFMRVISFEGDELKEVWKLNAYAVKPVLWDDDWDASPLILKDHLVTGGENGHLHLVRLNRSWLSNGHSSIKPKLAFNVPGWDDQLLADFPKPAVSIENSVAVYKNTVYFANSAGLLQGWDLSGVLDGKKPKRTFRLWLGDDTDATITIDSNGHLYVASEYEIGNRRSQLVGQVTKIDPKLKGDSAILWRKHIRSKKPDGVWASPALTEDQLIVPTDSGNLLGIDTATGKTNWNIDYGNQPLWSSPIVIEDKMLVATCDGKIDAYSLKNKLKPSKMWSLKVSNGCFEATAGLWDGKIFIGNRDGKLYGIW